LAAFWAEERLLSEAKDKSTVEDPKHLDAVFRRHYPALREKCRRLLGDSHEADDAAQETFVRLWKSGLAGGDDRKVTAWVFRTSTRVAIDRLRARRARAKLAEPAPAEIAAPLGVEARLDLEKLARRLPVAELELLLLQRWDGLSHPEIAEVTGRSQRTVRRLLHRCEERLARLKEESAR
jgi:RNA polymerase sigma-70 factor (ECF subfamily)